MAAQNLGGMVISDSTPDRPEFSLVGVDLEGSMLGEALKEHYGDEFFIAPFLGTVEGKRWFVEWDDDGPTVKESPSE